MVEWLRFSSLLKLVSSFSFNVAAGSATFMALLKQSHEEVKLWRSSQQKNVPGIPETRHRNRGRCCCAPKNTPALQARILTSSQSKTCNGKKQQKNKDLATPKTCRHAELEWDGCMSAQYMYRAKHEEVRGCMSHVASKMQIFALLT